jgi:molybdopterin adenylyltransferase
MMTIEVAVVTASDGVTAGVREDVSGDTAQRILEEAGFVVSVREVVPDDREKIAETLRRLSDLPNIVGIVTTGGTGIAARDVTPEATRDVIEKELPGMAEAMRMETLKHTPFAMLSRQVVGIRGKTLIVNLPGSPKAVAQCLPVVLPVVRHVLRLLAGHTSHDDQNTQAGQNA